MNKTQTIAEFKKRIETQNFTVSRIKNIVSMKKHKKRALANFFTQKI